MAITLNENGYAVRLSVPLTTLAVSSSMYGVAQPLIQIIRDQQGINRAAMSSIPVASSVLVMFDMPPVPYQIGNAGNNAPRGFKITDVTLAMAVSSGATSASNGASTPSFTAWVYPSSGFTDGATATTPPTAYGGSSSQWTMTQGSSTGIAAGTTIAPASTIQVISFVPGSGLNSWINVDNQRVAFEFYYIATASQNTLSIYEAVVHGTLALGG